MLPETSNQPIPPELAERLRVLAQTPLLLVACDYDGTLAEIVANPASAAPSPAAMEAFRTLTDFSWTTTAIISGRSLRDLDRFLGVDGGEWRVGSHGAEWKGTGIALSPERRAVLDEVADVIASVVDGGAGLRSELKPAGVALHYRTAERGVARAAVQAAIEELSQLPQVHLRHGNEVVEFMVLVADKGQALEQLREVSGATGVFFIGDDVTDEDAFGRLGLRDVGVKVGDGATRAQYRVADVAATAQALAQLARHRREWMRDRNSDHPVAAAPNTATNLHGEST